MEVGLAVTVDRDLDALADHAAALLSTPTGAVLAPEWVVVGSAPVRQWLDWRLAERLGATPGARDGTAANIRYLFPEELVREVTTAALGPTARPWDTERIALRLLALAGAPRSASRARRLAADIDDLLRWRPGVLTGEATPWAGLEDAVRAYHQLAATGARPADQWAALLDALQHARPTGVPARLLVFGITAPPGGPRFADLLRELATHAAVEVLVPAADVTRARSWVDGAAERDDRASLASWRRDGDEGLILWRAAAPRDEQWRIVASPRAAAATDLDRWRAPNQAPSDPKSGAPDGSILFIGAPGLSRQVEMLRDVVLDDLVASGSTTADVLVLALDLPATVDALERFWLADADDPHAPPRLTYEPTASVRRAARDRLSASVALLDLARGPATVEQLLILLEHATVEATLGLDRATRDRLARLAEEGAVTFGLSPTHAPRLGVYGAHGGLREDAGTWQRLLDRVVDATCRPPAGADDLGAVGVPDDLDALEGAYQLIGLASAIAEQRTEERPLSEWLTSLESWVTAVAGDGLDLSFAEALGRARRVTGADGDATDPVLTLDEFAEWWGLFAPTIARARIFGRHGVTVAPLGALDFAPHRTVCIVGLDATALPPPSIPSAVFAEQRPGDPDPRRATLGSLLAAAHAARERLIVTFSDRREDDGRPQDLAGPLEELLADVSAATGHNRAALLRRGSRHGFAIADDTQYAETHDPRYASPRAVAPLVPRLAPERGPTIEARAIREFLRGPAGYFVRHGLMADYPDLGDADDDTPPVSLDNRWRARARHAHLVGLAETLRQRGDDAGWPPFDGSHEPTDACRGEPCGWLHEPMAAWRAHSLGEGVSRSVPPRLWRASFQFELIELTAYNWASDQSDYEPLTLDERRELLHPGAPLAGDRLLATASLIAPAAAWPLVRGVNERTVLATTDVDLRAGTVAEWRGALLAAFDVALLAALARDREVRAVAYHPPDRTTPYLRPNSRSPGVRTGEFARNPTTALRFSGSAEDARAALERWAELFDEGRQRLLPLFRRTSLAQLRTPAKAAATWEGFGFSEWDEAPHSLLFPERYDDLAFEDAPALAATLRAALAHVEVAEEKQGARAPGRVLRDHDPERWHDFASATFVPLIDPEVA